MRKLFGTMIMSLALAVSLEGGALASSASGLKLAVKPTSTPATKVKVAQAVKPAPKPVPVPPKTYEVQSGDSLSTIAVTEQLDSWHPLWDANPSVADPNLIYAGEQLVVPTAPVADRPLPPGVAPLPEPVQTASRTTTVNDAAGAPGLLERIRMRESGGNYAANTGNGFYGAYQFTVGTWAGVGGTGLPSQASPAEQDMRAQMLLDTRGCSPWPNTCY